MRETTAIEAGADGVTESASTTERWGLTRREMVLLAAGALIVRLLYWAIVTPRWTPVADADQYVRLARSMADGTGFSLVFPQTELHATAFRPPLLPLVLTPASLLSSTALWPIRLTGSLIGCAVPLLGARFCGEVAGRRAAIVGGAVLAVYPPLLANDTVALTEPLALALLLAAVLTARHHQPVATGVLTGLLVLTRPNMYLVVALLAAALVLPWSGRRSLRSVALMVAVTAVVVAPWIVRNLVQVGTPRLTTSDGFTMAAMWSPEAQAAEDFVDPVFSPAFEDPRYRWAQFDEVEWNSVLTQRALEGVRESPTYLIGLAGRNALGYFELDPWKNRWPEENDGRDWTFRQWSLPVYAIVTTAGLVGIYRFRSHGHVLLLTAITAQFVILSLLLVAPPRLRAPFDLLCCTGVGLLAGSLGTRDGASEATEPDLPARPG